MKNKLSKAATQQILLTGLSYRKTAGQSGYSLPTIKRWANEQNIKSKVVKAKQKLKKEKFKRLRDHLPAFMDMLSKKHIDAYLQVFGCYQEFIEPQKKEEGNDKVLQGRALIITLLEEGISYRDVAKMTGSSTKTVNGIAKEISLQEKLKHKNKILTEHAVTLPLSAFMIWLKKHYKMYYVILEPIYNDYTSNN